MRARLAARGWHVYGGVRTSADGERLRGGRNDRAGAIDVTDPASIAATARVDRRRSAPDGLVNNAGIALAAPLEFLPLDELAPAARGQRRRPARRHAGVLPRSAPARGRDRLRRLDRAGAARCPFLGAYAMSKYALEAMADSLRIELRPSASGVDRRAGDDRDADLAKGGALFQQIADRMPPELGELLRRADGGVPRRGRRRGQGAAQAADGVASVVERALTAARPKARYLVGRDARLARAGRAPAGPPARPRAHARLLGASVPRTKRSPARAVPAQPAGRGAGERQAPPGQRAS